jgi:hypothetical protein
MRNLLAFLAAAILTFAGLGWYLDWYTISTSTADGGHRKVNIDINTPKIGEDFEKGGQKVREMIEKAGSKGTKTKDTQKDADQGTDKGAGTKKDDAKKAPGEPPQSPEPPKPGGPQ